MDHYGRQAIPFTMVDQDRYYVSHGGDPRYATRSAESAFGESFGRHFEAGEGVGSNSHQWSKEREKERNGKRYDDDRKDEERAKKG